MRCSYCIEYALEGNHVNQLKKEAPMTDHHFFLIKK